MFCPKCGNEISQDIKFCPKCGWQIVKESAAKNVSGNLVSQKADVRKIILIAVTALAVILVIALIANKIKGSFGAEETGSINITENNEISESVIADEADSGEQVGSSKEGGFDSYEDAIDALFTAAYNKDVEAVVNCFPEEMESYVKNLYNAYRTAAESGWSGELLNYYTGVFFAFEKLNMENEYWYEIVETTEPEQSHIYEWPSVFTRDELQTEYGLTFDEAYIVEVKSMGKYYSEQFGMTGYMTDGSRGYFEVAKIGGRWYVLSLDYVWSSDWNE